MSVLLILGRFYRKRTKNSKIWVISKVHAAAKVPSPQRGREGEIGQSWVRRGVVTVHNMENCYVLDLFRFLVGPRTRLLD